MSLNIETLNPQELAALIKRANSRRKVLAKRKPAAQTKAAVAKVLKASGWTFEELYGKTGGSATAAPAAKKARKAAKGRSTGKVAPKYRNPANEKDTWTGRGRQPRWVAAEIANGRKLEDLLIK
ncbi:H-NS family nucleoid-associated regulatory protein [Thermomonas fusca]|uniref:H-NS histone family protein n=1 Tax=Thermomonas fusca TaxID=215690 RepID=A0A5R9PHH8_9GAMM|nr:H-NS histone family protein [Thermomonas fusca]TLX22949.1 H-NS histone family protein [Thermomonas fusca]